MVTEPNALNWIMLSFVTAALEAVTAALTKVSARAANHMIVGMVMRMIMAAAVLPFAIVSSTEMPWGDQQFWTSLVISGGLNTITTALYIRAIGEGDISVGVPLLNFTAMFLLGSSFLFLGETPSPQGFGGVVLLGIGAYMMNASQARLGIWAPVRALLTNNTSRAMLIIALLWSVSSVFDKRGIQASSPLIWVSATNALIAMVFAVTVVAKYSRLDRSNTSPSPPYAPVGTSKVIGGVTSLSHAVGHVPHIVIALGLVNAVASVCQMQAFAIGLVSYVVAIKYTSAIAAVVIGAVFFGEREFRSRLAGTLVMVIGTSLILLS